MNTVCCGASERGDECSTCPGVRVLTNEALHAEAARLDPDGSGRARARAFLERHGFTRQPDGRMARPSAMPTAYTAREIREQIYTRLRTLRGYTAIAALAYLYGPPAGDISPDCSVARNARWSRMCAECGKPTCRLQTAPDGAPLAWQHRPPTRHCLACHEAKAGLCKRCYQSDGMGGGCLSPAGLCVFCDELASGTLHSARITIELKA